MQKFVQSPYHNQHKAVEQLLDYVLANRRCSYEKAHQYLYPKQPISIQKVRNLMSYLQKLVDKFLIYESLENQDVPSQLALASVYRKQNLQKAFNNTITQSTKLLEKTPHKNADYYHQHYQLKTEEYLFNKQIKRTYVDDYQALLDNFDIYYLANKLKLSVIGLTHEAFFGAEYKHELLLEVLKCVEQRDLIDVPAISVYYYSYQALVDPNNSDAFFKLKENLQQHASLFPAEELRDIYLLAINFGIKRLNTGDENFAQELFELYQMGLEKDIFLEEGKFSRFTFKNIVTIGLKVDAFEWVQEFIHEFSPLLDLPYRADYQNYNLAKWHYARKDYKQAMQLLLDVRLSDRSIWMGARITLLKIYYELQEISALEALLESFRIYIQRHKKDLSEYLQRSYLNFIKYSKKLLNHNFHDRKKTLQLIETIEKEQHLPERNWLLFQLGIMN
ncbi:MAG: hypothetical protein GY810_29175 [Aureispira sp.]|nr:hypothetical protein [Aureispira sp.]